MPNMTVFLYDGTGKPFKDGNALLRFRQGMTELKSVYVDGSSIEAHLDLEGTLQPLAVVASCANYIQCGYLVQPDKLPRQLHLMLVHQNEWFDFEGNYDLWDVLKAKRPSYAAFLNTIPDGKAAAAKLMKDDPASLACFLNILEAIQWLPNGKEVIATMQTMELSPRLPSEWKGIQQDRIFIQATKALVPELEKTDIFAFAPNLLHPGSDKGFKETGRFTEANLNFSLDTKSIAPKDSVLADVDLDYYADAGAHFALEVIPNTTSSWVGLPQKTNPARTYAMRWMGIRNYQDILTPADDHAGRRTFDPLFTISAG